MNNSKISLDEFNLGQEVDRTPWLREKEASLVRQIEALRRVAASEDWSSLKKEIFDGVVETLEKAQKVEASKDKPDLSILTNINGQLVWARKWCDLKKLADILMVELNSIRKKLNQ